MISLSQFCCKTWQILLLLLLLTGKWFLASISDTKIVDSRVNKTETVLLRNFERENSNMYVAFEPFLV